MFAVQEIEAAVIVIIVGLEWQYKRLYELMHLQSGGQPCTYHLTFPSHQFTDCASCKTWNMTYQRTTSCRFQIGVQLLESLLIMKHNRRHLVQLLSGELKLIKGCLSYMYQYSARWHKLSR
jgi:hypothetical protein